MSEPAIELCGLQHRYDTTLVLRRSLALLSAIGVWLIITFVVPQFTSGLRPTQSLNPLTEPVGTSQAFFRVTQAQPLSIVEQYKTAAGTILGTSPNRPTTETVLTIVPIVVAGFVLIGPVLWRIQRHDYARSASDE